MWQPDPSLCAECSLSRDVHAQGVKCPYGPTYYSRTALEMHWHGAPPDAAETTVDWVCYVCKGAQASTFPLPVLPSALKVTCRWSGCDTVNRLNFP